MVIGDHLVMTAEPMHLCGSWYAVPAEVGQPAVLDAFGLAGAYPVSMSVGSAAWTADRHDWDRGEHGRCARMYVTPGLDDWILVFGTVPEVAHTTGEGAFERAVRAHTAWLSGRFGTAHWYGASCGDGWTSWCLAEDGAVIARHGVVVPEPPGLRYYDDLVPLSTPPSPRHEQLTVDGGAVPLRPRRRPTVPEHAHATTVAARLSVNPAALGPHTTVTGHGVLALTACGQQPRADFRRDPRRK